jgi:hypothetical protein
VKILIIIKLDQELGFSKMKSKSTNITEKHRSSRYRIIKLNEYSHIFYLVDYKATVFQFKIFGKYIFGDHSTIRLMTIAGNY